MKRLEKTYSRFSCLETRWAGEVRPWFKPNGNHVFCLQLSYITINTRALLTSVIGVLFARSLNAILTTGFYLIFFRLIVSGS